MTPKEIAEEIVSGFGVDGAEARKLSQAYLDLKKKYLETLEYLHAATRCNPEIWDTDGICHKIDDELRRINK